MSAKVEQTAHYAQIHCDFCHEWICSATRLKHSDALNEARGEMRQNYAVILPALVNSHTEMHFCRTCAERFVREFEAQRRKADAGT